MLYSNERISGGTIREKYCLYFLKRNLSANVRVTLARLYIPNQPVTSSSNLIFSFRIGLFSIHDSTKDDFRTSSGLFPTARVSHTKATCFVHVVQGLRNWIQPLLFQQI